MIHPRWALITKARHFPTIPFPVERFWLRRSAIRRARAYRASYAGTLFTYELHDTRTQERTPL
jgi:hypothetical protein